MPPTNFPDISPSALPSQAPFNRPAVADRGQRMARRQLWSLLRELHRSDPSPALDALRNFYETLVLGAALEPQDPPADFPTKGGRSTGGCSICVFDLFAGFLHMVLDPLEMRTIQSLEFFVLEEGDVRHAFKSPADAIRELVERGSVTWVLSGAAAGIAAPVGAWVRFGFAEGAPLTEVVTIAETK